ncbi:proteasome-associated protein [Planoprotostelium fungivorum]|uniref:Proteasome-associated protein n=1 Tax=Planoprotostelium fungivorum TaxID=1890364 RepID=A0A2P6NZG9_9EUKA|nr:proteasome-associated protein [Planoprotostelium fungivorum]
MADEATKDVNLLDTVLTRFAVSSDQDMEKQLKNLLIPVMGKLASPHETVRKKKYWVMLTSESNPCLRSKFVLLLQQCDLTFKQLPIKELLDLYMQQQPTALVCNFIIMYLDMGFHRMPSQDRGELAPQLLKNLSIRPQAQRDSLLPLFLSVIEHIPVPPEEKKEEKFTFTTNNTDRDIVLRYLADTLLAQISHKPDEKTYGLSVKIVKHIASKTPSKEYLLGRKIAIIDFIGRTGAFSENDMAFLYIIGSCDSHHTVIQKSEDGMKRIKIDYEDRGLVDRLYATYLGGGDKNLPAEERRISAHPVLKSKLMNCFSRSAEAANSFPNTVQVFFDCVYGEDSTFNLKVSGMSFVQWVFRTSNDQQISLMAPIILSGLLKLIRELIEKPSGESSRILSFTYSAVGILARRVPQLFYKDLGILNLYLTNLSTTEEESVLSSIQEGLVSMVTAYRSVDTADLDQIRILLSHNISKTQPRCRYISLYYGNRLFPFSSPFGRMNCLLCSEDSSTMNRDESNRGLKPYSWKDKDKDISPDNEAEWPKFDEMMEYVKVSRTVKQNGRAFSDGAYQLILKFLRNCMDISAKKEEQTLYQYNQSVLQNHPGTMTAYVDLLDGAVDVQNVTSSLAHTAAEGILQTLSLCLHLQVGKHYAEKKNWLLDFMWIAGGHETREMLAKCLGLSVYNLSDVDVDELLKRVTQESHEEQLQWEKRLGAVYGLGYVSAGIIKKGGVTSHREDTMRSALYNLYNILPTPSQGQPTTEISQISLLLASIQAVGLMFRYNSLSFIEEGKEMDDAEKKEGKNYEISSRSQVTKRLLVYKITRLLTHSDTRIAERSAVALGNVLLSDRNAPFKKEILSSLYNSGAGKNFELHFTVGEVLSIIGAGWASTAAADPHFEARPEDHPSTTSQDDDVMDELLKEILGKQLASDRYRSAACIWLLSIVKHCGTHSGVKKHLQTIQTAFSHLLADPDEVTQEAASRGLVFVYQESSEEQKGVMVKTLISTLSSGKKSGYKVSGDSEILPKDLVKTPDGNSVSTYSQLVGLATEMGQPSLIYKFLELSSQHSLWNSRKGAAFTVKSILGEEYLKKQMEPVLPQLVPKLYRASYDPNPKISSAMTNILASLVDVKKVSSDYFDQIVVDLMDAMVSNLWRSRESACHALTDALQGKTFVQVRPHLCELWYRGFRVVDDIKETVRTAAKSLLKTLSALTTRLTDPAMTNPLQVEDILKELLPLLLGKGLVSESEDAREISLSQILKTAKAAGNMLAPHIPNLVGVLLEGLSAMENSSLNYMAFHTQSMGISQEQFEEARISISKFSPLNETLDICIKYIDEKNIGEVVGKIVETIKTGVGLPTKVATAKFIVQLVLQKQELLSPHAGKILNALLGSMREKSPVIRKAYAGALGNVAKFASPKVIKSLTEKLLQLYSDVENEELRVTAGTAFLEIVRRSNEAFRLTMKETVPVIYYARNDPVEAVQKVFQEVWDESGVGGVSLYMQETVKFLENSLGADSWVTKRQAAVTLKTLATNASRDSTLSYLDDILKMLVTALPGRLWKGKDSLLSALATICSQYHEEITTKFSTAEGEGAKYSPSSLVEQFIRECKKNDKEYKRHAINSLRVALEAFQQTDNYDKVAQVILPIAKGEEDSLGADEGDAKDKPLTLLIRGSAFLSLGYAWPLAVETQKARLHELLDVMCSAVPQNIWSIRISIYESLTRILSRSHFNQGVVDGQMVKKLVECISVGLSDNKYNAVRSAALDMLEALTKGGAETDLMDGHVEELVTMMNAASAMDTSLLNGVGRIKRLFDENPRKKHKTIE